MRGDQAGYQAAIKDKEVGRTKKAKVWNLK
jgi:hypothetical protein